MAQVDGVIAAGGILIAKDLDAQEADDGGDAVAIGFQLLGIGIAVNLQIHFAAPDEFVEQGKGEVEVLDDRHQFLVDRESGGGAPAGAADILPPLGQLGAALLRGHGILVRDIIHFAAKGVERRHGIAFGLGQQDKGQREIGGALAGDGAAVLHHRWEGYGPSVFPGGRTGGSPPFSASVGLGLGFPRPPR